MTVETKRNVLGILIDAVDSESAVRTIVEAARQRRGLAVSAVAVHAVMTGVFDAEHKYRLNDFDLLVPDGQPVRWALNLLYGMGLRQRVYGPDLMLAVCEEAERQGLGVYLYGSDEEVLTDLVVKIGERFPGLTIAGSEPSKFRRLTPLERDEVKKRVLSSGAHILFVGLGCPLQEIWAYEFREDLSIPILAVGAAFAFLAGRTPQAPRWMQDRGLEWLFRFKVEPRRLWRRYLLLNPCYLALLFLQAIRLRRFPTDGRRPRGPLLPG